MMMYKVIYVLVAIPAPLYLVLNSRTSRHIHSLAYRQIQALKYYYRFTFFPGTIIQWNAIPTNILTLPTLTQFSSAVCQVIHVSLEISTPGFIFYLYNTPCTVQSHLTTFSITLFQLTPSALGIREYPSDVPHGGEDVMEERKKKGIPPLHTADQPKIP